MKVPDGESSVPKWKQYAGAAGLSFFLKRLTDADLDADEPRAVSSSKETSALRHRALDLAAEDDVEDATAIRELQMLAGRRRKRLLSAAASIRMGGHPYRESRTALRANRLLRAAAGRPVPPPTAEEEEFLDEIELMWSLPRDQGFARLAEREPRLRDVERRLPESDEVGGSMSFDEEDIVLDEIINELLPLLGPQSDATDPLLRTVSAVEVARNFLAQRAGVARVDDGAEDPLERLARAYGVRPNPREIADVIRRHLNLAADESTKSAILVMVVAMVHTFPETLDRLAAGEDASRRYREYVVEASGLYDVRSPEDLLSALLGDVARAVGNVG